MSGAVFSADFDTEVFVRALRFQSDRALPETVAIALNQTARAIADRSRANVRQRMTVRTSYTINSIRQDRHARGRNVHAMFSRVGTKSPYLPLQNAGGEVRARRRSVPIPTVKSRTGGSIARRIAARYSMNRLGGMDKGSRYFMGRPHSGAPLGIYERHAGNKRLRLLRRLGHSRVRVPATRWFDDAINAHAHLAAARFRREAARRLRMTPGQGVRR